MLLALKGRRTVAHAASLAYGWPAFPKWFRRHGDRLCDGWLCMRIALRLCN